MATRPQRTSLPISAGSRIRNGKAQRLSVPDAVYPQTAAGYRSDYHSGHQSPPPLLSPELFAETLNNAVVADGPPM